MKLVTRIDYTSPDNLGVRTSTTELLSNEYGPLTVKIESSQFSIVDSSDIVLVSGSGSYQTVLRKVRNELLKLGVNIESVSRNKVKDTFLRVSNEKENSISISQ